MALQEVRALVIDAEERTVAEIMLAVGGDQIDFEQVKQIIGACR